jgi:hypothetical protein
VTHIVGQKFDSAMDAIEWKIAAAIEVLNSVITQLRGLPLGEDISLVQEHVLTNTLGFSPTLTAEIIKSLQSPTRRSVDMGNLWGYYNVVNEVLRQRSRSEYRNEVINATLMDDIIAAYINMMNPTPTTLAA